MKDKPLRIEEASVSFGFIEVFRHLSLEISRGEFVAVVGPSGCGKTTLLNLFSGFLKPSSGNVICSGRVRMVYQHDSLFPWQTTAQNIALGLRDLNSEAERERQLREMLRLINLEEFAEHYPHQLSGGMRQRVELGRALAAETDILLLDEPFSALDYQTRTRMRRELATTLAARPRTVVFVTHDIEEAVQLGDRVVVLGPRPTRTRRILPLPPGRPRAPADSGVAEAEQTIMDELGLS